MREIKFRAKVLGTDALAYGYLSKDAVDTYYITSQDGVDTYVIDPETVGQFTGLKDKNGVEIYEGDITSSGYVIFWEKEKCLFGEHWFQGYHKIWSVASYPIDVSRIEVIGNIHQNPELL